LFVIARNSGFTYKRRAVDVKQVGRELGVRYVLEGSLRKSGDRIRLTTQLVEADTGKHLERLLWRQSVQGLLEIAARYDILVAAEADGAPANPLDDGKDRRAALLADRVAEDAAEQTDILAQRQVLVFAFDRLWLRHGTLLHLLSRLVPQPSLQEPVPD